MNLSTWLDADRGRLTALAKHFDLTPSAVSQWRAKGVPVNRMKPVRDFTEGAVTLEEMVPDLAPEPEQPPARERAHAVTFTRFDRRPRRDGPSKSRERG